MTELYTHLKQFGKVKTNEPFAKHTTFKIGGPAEFFVSVSETEKLVDLLKYLDGEGVPYFIFGGGSNMLVSDDGFDGVVISVNSRQSTVNENVFIADAGVPTVEVAQRTMQAGLTGFEWGVGVPGTIGGAVRGNAGAMGGEMRDSVEKIEVYRNGEVFELSNEECKLDYRDSVFKHEGGVILRVHMKLDLAAPDAVLMQKAMEHLKYRNASQPQGFSSSGCIFKNVEYEMKNVELLKKHFQEDSEIMVQFKKVGKISAGWLVEQAEMKGKQIGNAKVSETHGNFLVNVGGATFSDVISLIEEVKEAVYTKFGIELEEEVSIIQC
jgi:UDP-N-acetylmuramate dehydrogenase